MDLFFINRSRWIVCVFIAHAKTSMFRHHTQQDIWSPQVICFSALSTQGNVFRHFEPKVIFFNAPFQRSNTKTHFPLLESRCASRTVVALSCSLMRIAQWSRFINYRIQAENLLASLAWKPRIAVSAKKKKSVQKKKSMWFPLILPVAIADNAIFRNVGYESGAYIETRILEKINVHHY